jgi:hypothetical protein
MSLIYLGLYLVQVLLTRRPTRWDEWISFDSPRVSPFRTRTVHTGNSGYLSPSPNTIASFAPLTGRDDIRRILPAILDVYEQIGPALREAVALASEVNI